jgi:hypothetical protein
MSSVKCQWFQSAWSVCRVRLGSVEALVTACQDSSPPALHTPRHLHRPADQQCEPNTRRAYRGFGGRSGRSRLSALQHSQVAPAILPFGNPAENSTCSYQTQGWRLVPQICSIRRSGIVLWQCRQHLHRRPQLSVTTVMPRRCWHFPPFFPSFQAPSLASPFQILSRRSNCSPTTPPRPPPARPWPTQRGCVT